jgi:ABC-type nitrate/sulfonate/bicarbonate transport system ATPase subunit
MEIPTDGIDVSNLSFSYGQMPLFCRFSLKSSERRVVIKGPSGCGKTTLLRLLFGSLDPGTGACLPRFATSVLVLQEDALFPWLSGRSNITRFIRIDEITLKTHPLFEVVADFIDRPVFRLSYGQRRTVELFRAILYRPQVLYLDEPFNYLDDKRSNAFISALLDATDTSSRLVMTTHRHDHSLDSTSAVFTFVGEPPYSALEISR